MNKYQKALDYVNKSVCTALACLGIDDPITREALHILQELVDKATPKKPLVKKYENSEHYICPKCQSRRFGIIDYGEYKNQWRKGSELTPNCQNCGQALDWSDEK